MEKSYMIKKDVNTRSFLKKIIVVLCLLVSMVLIPTIYVTAQVQGSVPAQDSLALVALYNSLNGDQWVNKGGWLVDRVDTWRGVKTANVGTSENPEWRVVEFSSRSNLTVPGTLPPEVGNLTYLSFFEMRDEPLFGELPAEFGQLQFLTSLNFRGTQMTGELPWSSLVNAKSLQAIRIDGGTLFGDIPDIVGTLNIREFNIEQNFLSGSIPNSITNWTELERFGVLDNNLTGEVPDMSVFPELDVLRLGDNPLEPGPLWSWMEGMTQLQALFIVNANRTGEIPSWFYDLLIQNLRIGESNPALANALGGTLSEDFKDMPALEVLQIEGINWVGELPEWMNFLDRVDFFNCSFTGQIPGSYASMSRLRIRNCPNLEGGLPEQFATFRGTVFEWINDPVEGPWGFPWGNEFIEFSKNFYGNPKANVGQLPDWIGLWGSTNIVLRGVGITGPIPEGLNQNANLRVLDLSYNPGLTGTIPEWLQARSMTYMDVSHTGLTVTEIPTWINNNNWRRLTTLGLAGLGIEGNIPDFMWTRYLELGTLDLSNNKLTGTIPSTIGNLTRLSTLNLSNNLLEGELPATFETTGYFLGQHSLVLLDLSGNENLSGMLPQRLTSSSNMLVLRYNNTKIAAPDDAGFKNFLENVIPGNGSRFYPPVFVDVKTSGLVGTGTSIEYTENPYRFHLGANFPNPFNPTTTFSYQIPEDRHVTLTVYTVLGQVAATLVDEIKVAGRHEITFDARSLSSGVYLYRLTAGNQTMTRSMLLVK
jgi:Leucine-rich repeat (LRR) protein